MKCSGMSTGLGTGRQALAVTKRMLCPVAMHSAGPRATPSSRTSHIPSQSSKHLRRRWTPIGLPSSTRAVQQRAVDTQQAAAETTDPSQGVLIPVIDPKRKNEDGTYKVKWTVVEPEAIADPIPRVDQDKLIQGLNRIDAAPAYQYEKARVELPGTRVIKDPEELDLVGLGLPIIKGVSCWQRRLWLCVGYGLQLTWCLDSISACTGHCKHGNVLDRVMNTASAWTGAHANTRPACMALHGRSEPMARMGR